VIGNESLVEDDIDELMRECRDLMKEKASIVNRIKDYKFSLRKAK
jgi:hypothetical protein